MKNRSKEKKIRFDRIDNMVDGVSASKMIEIWRQQGRIDDHEYQELVELNYSEAISGMRSKSESKRLKVQGVG